MIGPRFASLAVEHVEEAICVKVDVDANQETARHYSITAMPTFKFFKNEKEIDTL